MSSRVLGLGFRNEFLNSGNAKLWQTCQKALFLTVKAGVDSFVLVSTVGACLPVCWPCRVNEEVERHNISYVISNAS